MSDVNKHHHGSFSWTDLMTSDNEAAKKFYCELFGWDSKDMPTDDQGGVYTMYFVRERSVAASFQATEQMGGGPPRWQTYFTVDNVDAMLKTIRDNGGAVVGDPTDVFDSGRMLVCQDPQGAFFMLWQPRSHIGAQIKDEPKSIGWAELLTTDQAGALKFYSAVLSAKESFEAMPDGRKYGMLFVDNKPSSGVMQITKEMGEFPPHWGIYFFVEDIDAAIERTESLGGAVVWPKMQVQPELVVVGLKDPQGAHFSVMQQLTQ